MPDSLVQKNLLKVVLGNYLSGPSTAISDPGLLPEVQQYKRLVASQLAPLAWNDINRKIPNEALFVSRKIDGEFNAAVYRDDQIFMLNPGGTVRIGLPFLEDLKSQLQKANINEAIIAGELYVGGIKDRSRIHDTVSLLRHPANQDELNKVHFAIFDLISWNGQRINQLYSQTWEMLSNHFATTGSSGPCHLVETVKATSTLAVQDQFTKWVEQESAEGIVVRSDSAGSFKIKPLYTLDAVVIGFTESTDDRTGMLHDLLLAVRRKDGALHVLGRVGGGFSDEQRRSMLSDLQDLVVESEYAEVNSDHIAYQMVRPDWVVEINCLDLVAQNTRGRPVNRMTLQFDESESLYKIIRRLPLVSVISPQFIRIREDKSAANSHDTRIQQIDDIVPVPLADADTNQLKLPKSELLQREVYVKTLRGEKLVRKFLLWKTNKQDEGDNYPAFVAYHSDFSPTRKTPLTREVRISSSETQILAL
ncbi:MAG: hypothetical protein AAGA30_19980, partial [Planctomycetota bacterium]